MTYQSRSAWTSRKNNAVAVKQTQKHLTWHYPGFGTDSVKTASWAHSRCLSQIDTWERQHQARGSKNVEYNYFACTHGYLIEGRGDRQNGANGTSASNRTGQSIQVLIGDNEPLSAGHLAAMREGVARIDRLRKGATARQYGHRHWVGTRCPGPYVMAAIPVGPAVSGGGTSAPAPSKPKPAAKGKLVEDGRMGTASSSELQRTLNASPKTKRKLKIDGRLGPDSYMSIQEHLDGNVIDGLIENQSYRPTELGNGIGPHGWEFTGRGSKGSATVRRIQRHVGVDADGIWYESTSLAIQKALNAGKF